MIEKMRKYSFFTFEPEYESFLQTLKKLGVVHIKNNTDPGQIEHFKEIEETQSDISRLLSRLNGIKSNYPLAKDQSPDEIPHPAVKEGETGSYDAYVAAFDRIDRQIKEHQKELDRLHAQQRDLETWGDFDPTLIEKLKESGHFLHFWTVMKTQYNPDWEELYDAQIIDEAGRSVYFVTVDATDAVPDLEFAEPISLPKGVSLSSLKVKEETLKKDILSLRDSQAYLAFHAEALKAKRVELENTYRMDNALLQGVRLYDNKLVVLEGWVPDPKAPAMEAALSADNVVFEEMAFNPKEEDVPVVLKNNRFVRVFEPLVKMFSLPNYNEFDPTAFIAPFFMLFFGMCFGDSGYGLLYLLLATYIKTKVGASWKPFVELFQWLSLAGLVIGFFSGSFFGIALVEVPFLQKIKGFFISQNNMMIIALALGFVHILFAKFVSAFKVKKQEGLTHSLHEFAWPLLIVFLAVLFGLPFLNIAIPKPVEYVLWGLVAVCIALAFLLNMPGKNIFANIGNGLWTTYGVASGLLGDTLSYIRLFAIGLTGSILGSVFNTLAATVTEGMPWYGAIPLGAVILILGHGINIGLTTISALVHPIRLIYVEYFNNSNYEGGGKPYEPLKNVTLGDTAN